MSRRRMSPRFLGVKKKLIGEEFTSTSGNVSSGISFDSSSSSNDSSSSLLSSSLNKSLLLLFVLSLICISLLLSSLINFYRKDIVTILS